MVHSVHGLVHGYNGLIHGVHGLVHSFHGLVHSKHGLVHGSYGRVHGEHGETDFRQKGVLVFIDITVALTLFGFPYRHQLHHVVLLKIEESIEYL